MSQLESQLNDELSKQRKEKRMNLFNKTRRGKMKEHSDRREGWARWISATNLLTRKELMKTAANKLSLEETKVLEKLALRLEINGIQVDDSTTVPTDDLGHDRVHPTRRHLIRTENPVNKLLALPEIKERLKGVQHSDWTILADGRQC